MTDHLALANRCMDILSDQVGVVEAERFIYFIKTEAFDYTKWQREHYDSIADDVLRERVRKYGEEHPFKGKKAVNL